MNASLNHYMRRAVAWLGLEGYGPAAARDDVTAAATVAIVALPQSMAYALIAGVDPVYGLYTAVVSATVGSLLGSSNHLITGPTNAIALMIAGTMKAHDPAAATFYPTLFLLTVMVGVIQLALGLLRAGKIVNFVSHTVIVGFTAGAGVIIGLGQLNELLGIALPSGYHPLYEKVWLTLRAAAGANPYACLLAGGTIAIVLLARRLSRRFPGALLALVLCSIAAAVFDLGGKGVRLVGEMPRHLPGLALPSLSPAAALTLFGNAFAIAVVGLVEALAIAKSISLSSGQRIDPDREFAAQGAANIVGGFFSCFAASGSFTRSAVNYNAQARTRVAGVLSGLFVAATLVFLAGYARFIPRASLAAVIVLVACAMVDQHAMRRMARISRRDLGVMLLTVGATVIMPDLERAILTGVVVSVLVHLWNTGEVKVKLLHPGPGQTFHEIDPAALPRDARRPDIPLIHIEGNLYFGSSGDLEEKLRRIAERSDARVFILRLKRVQVVDISALEVLEAFVDRTLAAGRQVLLCGLDERMKRFLDKVGLTARVGAGNVFAAEERIYQSTGKAWSRAEEILRTPPA